jgi:hypothetical protein
MVKPTGDNWRDGTVLRIRPGKGPDALALVKEDGRLVLHWSQGRARRFETIGKLTRGEWAHVALRAGGKGRAAALVNGRKTVLVERAGLLDDLATRHLRLGGGVIQRVAIYSRPLSDREVLRNYVAGRHALAEREPATRVVVDARLVKRTPTPAIRELQEYRRAMVIHQYEVRKVIEGELDAERIRVAHWAVMDRTPLKHPETLKVGRTYRLTLEPYDEHPELEAERSFQAFEDWDSPTFLEVTPIASLEP